MIHILTVHWQSDKWIDIQLEYLKRNITDDYRVYAFLNGISESHSSKFYYTNSDSIQEHEVKLNRLAKVVLDHSTDQDDLLIFLDGDAFPIGDIVTFAREKLKNYPLLAIQRRENLGDMQPHPSFCATTTLFWQKIGGDWARGYTWLNKIGNKVCDTGGVLMSVLNEKGIEWYPMLRSNRINLHPLWFGIYDNLVYHHGAGFRNPVARVDKNHSKNLYYSVYFKHLKKLPYSIHKNFDPTKSIIRRNGKKSNKVYKMILSDPSFYEYFLNHSDN